MSHYQLDPPPRLGTPAIVAIVMAASSYALSCSGHGIWGLITAILGVICGAIGILWAALPGVRGALLSVSAIVLSALAIIPAILAMLGKLAMHL